MFEAKASFIAELIFTLPPSWLTSSEARLTLLAVHQMTLPEIPKYDA